MKNHRIHRNGLFVAWVAISWASTVALADGADRIRPNEANPFYWQYRGQPVLLLYCIQNESFQDLAFGDDWAEHILRRARGRNPQCADADRCHG